MLTIKLLFIALCFLGVAVVSLRAVAAPNDLRITQENPAGGLTTIRMVTIPAASASGALTYDGTTQRPVVSTLGGGLTITGGILDVVGGAGQINSDWASGSGVSQILNKPTLGNASAITATALGLALMTATLPVDARTIIQAGTSSFAGGYADLTGIPSSFVPSAHTHTQAEVQGLTTTLAGITSTVATKLTTPAGSSTTQYVSGDGSLQTLPAAFAIGFPTTRTFAVSTSYQATNAAKSAFITVSPQCTNATTVIAASACTLQVRVHTTTATCANGIVVATWTSQYALGLLLTNTSGSPIEVKLPATGNFILCPTAGTFAVNTGVEQLVN